MHIEDVEKVEKKVVEKTGENQFRYSLSDSRKAMEYIPSSAISLSLVHTILAGNIF